ncbi:hypothetical protein [Kitasatospora sp. LaBMicrA B282]|uniref:hypothetical protein n=1 Tax=Kitasatospora sp. LaBMicrA B282 TaxID=3420949 RepID=UPI003D0E0BF9
MPMDPAVTAAWIAAGTSIVSFAGTVAVAIVGFRAAEKVGAAANATAATNTKHFVNATRDDHLWEKQGARAYEEVLAHIHFRSLRLEANLRSYRFDEQSEKNMEKFFESYQPESWFHVQARAVAYASADVMEAFELATRADIEAKSKFNSWTSMADHNRGIALAGAAHSEGFSGEDVIKARSEAVAAAEALQKCDGRVMDLIRAELHSNPRIAAATK